MRKEKVRQTRDKATIFKENFNPASMQANKEVNELVITRLKQERKQWRQDHPHVGFILFAKSMELFWEIFFIGFFCWIF